MSTNGDSPNPPNRRLEKTGTPGIFRRGSRYIVRYRDADGRQRQRTARTMVEARRLKAAMNADVARGEHRELSRETFAEYAQEWGATYQGRTGSGIRPHTLKDYTRDLEMHVTPVLGKRRLSAIELRDIKKLARVLADKGLAPSTVRNIIAPVRALFATAVEEGVLRHNPALGLRLPGTRPGPEQVKALTPEQLALLIDKTPDEWKLLVRFVAATGLRIGEVVALRWEHIDFERRRVLVRERRYKETVDAPKSRYGRRDVPISTEMAKALKRARASSRYPGPLAPVFPTLRGTPHRPENLLRRVLKESAKGAGVPWAGWHTLRHTCATDLFRAGASAKQVQIWLGHHSPAFTLGTYVHLLAEDLPDPNDFSV